MIEEKSPQVDETTPFEKAIKGWNDTTKTLSEVNPMLITVRIDELVRGDLLVDDDMKIIGAVTHINQITQRIMYQNLKDYGCDWMDYKTDRRRIQIIRAATIDPENGDIITYKGTTQTLIKKAN